MNLFTEQELNIARMKINIYNGVYVLMLSVDLVFISQI